MDAPAGSLAVWGEGAGCATLFSTDPGPHPFSDLAPVVQKMESAIHRISIRETNCVIKWIASAIHLSKNGRLASRIYATFITDF